MESLLTENRIFKQRTVDIGGSTGKGAGFGFSGPCLRGSDVLDLRKAQPYDAYDKIDFSVAIGKTGDCYARYLVRVAEMRESLKSSSSAWPICRRDRS